MPKRHFTKTKHLRLIANHRLLAFLVLLLSMLSLFPFVEAYATDHRFALEFSFLVLLTMGIYIVTIDKRIMAITILLALLTITIIGFNHLLNYPSLLLISLFLEIVFVGFTAIVIISHVLRYKRVTADKIYGAMCGYFLIGIVWALIFTLIENAFPGAFRFTPNTFVTTQAVFGHHFYFSQFLYFSFSTLTTLGYGDIVPLIDIARVASSFEAMFGQLYIAVLISRLVGLHIVHTHYQTYR